MEGEGRAWRQEGSKACAWRRAGDSGKYSWNGELWPFQLVLLHHLNLILLALGSH